MRAAKIFVISVLLVSLAGFIFAAGQQEKADDFVAATGEIHTVREFAEEAFAVVGLNWKDHVEVDPLFIPPVQTGPLCGDPSKAKKLLGWEPKTRFKDLVRIMIHSDLAKFS